MYLAYLISAQSYAGILQPYFISLSRMDNILQRLDSLRFWAILLLNGLKIKDDSASPTHANTCVRVIVFVVKLAPTQQVFQNSPALKLPVIAGHKIVTSFLVTVTSIFVTNYLAASVTVTSNYNKSLCLCNGNEVIVTLRSKNGQLCVLCSNPSAKLTEEEWRFTILPTSSTTTKSYM